VDVTVTSFNPIVGIITTSPVTISAGANLATTQFRPLSAGSTMLTAGVPAGFSTPSAYTTVLVSVATPGLAITDQVSVGANLEKSGAVILGAPAPLGGLDVTLTSGDPGLLLLSLNATDAGAASIIVHIPAGMNNGTYYLQALGTGGTVTYTASATGYSNKIGTVTLAPSGLVLAGPFGFGMFFTNLSTPATLTIYTAQLDPFTNTYVEIQPLRAGFSVNASLNTSNPAVGSIAPMPVTIIGGSDNAVTTFSPLAVGQTTVSLVRPPNFGVSGDKNSLLGMVSP
jgi:hypothetical protein